MIDTVLRISVSSRSANVSVTAREGARFQAVHGTQRVAPDGTIVVEADRHGSSRIEIICPTGSHVTVGTASGDIKLAGEFGSARIVTGSGKIEIGRVTGVDVRTASGGIEVEHCEGECRAVTKSGRVHVERAHAVEISTVSGRIEADEVEVAGVTTVSGTVSIGSVTKDPDFRIRTVSGKVSVEVAETVSPTLTLRSVSGRVRCDCAQGTNGTIAVETTSGSIQVRHR